jgi:hypothetical protein
MRTLAALDLGKIRLADGLAGLGLNALHQLLLGEGTIHAAEGTFDLAEVADFFAQRHICQIAIIISQYEIMSSTAFGVFTRGYAEPLPRPKKKASARAEAGKHERAPV